MLRYDLNHMLRYDLNHMLRYDLNHMLRYDLNHVSADLEGNELVSLISKCN
jgi:hypothetical protein